MVEAQQSSENDREERETLSCSFFGRRANEADSYDRLRRSQKPDHRFREHTFKLPLNHPWKIVERKKKSKEENHGGPSNFFSV